MKCSACNIEGHNRNNKKCPNYSLNTPISASQQTPNRKRTINPPQSTPSVKNTRLSPEIAPETTISSIDGTDVCAYLDAVNLARVADEFDEIVGTVNAEYNVAEMLEKGRAMLKTDTMLEDEEVQVVGRELTKNEEKMKN